MNKRKNELKNIVIRGNEGLIKPFSYNLNNMHLAFSLNVENKKDLIDFKRCLEEAIIDVKKYIDKLWLE